MGMGNFLFPLVLVSHFPLSQIWLKLTELWEIFCLFLSLATTISLSRHSDFSPFSIPFLINKTQVTSASLRGIVLFRCGKI